MEAVIRLKSTKQPIMLGKSLKHCKDRLRPMFLKHTGDKKSISSFDLEVAEITEKELIIWKRQYEVIEIYTEENLNEPIISQGEQAELDSILSQNGIGVS